MHFWLKLFFKLFLFTRTGLEENSKQIEFVLPAMDTNNCYFISNIMIEVQVKITKKDGTLPSATTKVAPVANMLSSLFETVSLRVNDVLITSSGSHYGYKDYVQTLLTFSGDAKASLQAKVYFDGLKMNLKLFFLGIPINFYYTHFKTL